MKKVLMITIVLLLIITTTIPVNAQSSLVDKTKNFFTGIYSDVSSRSIEENVEGIGLWIIKAQETIQGATKFLTLGIYNDGTDRGIIPFLFFALVFMVIYSSLSYNESTKKLALPIAIIIGIIGVRYLTTESITIILTTYEALGALFTIILPTIIILTFSYSIYHKTHKGNSNTSPFYANLFNFFFLNFFGVYYIRYGIIQENGLVFGSPFIITGIILIIIGFSQFFLYKAIAKAINKEKVNKIKEIAKDKQIKAEILGKYKKILSSRDPLQ